jgi:hypothetical protein
VRIQIYAKAMADITFEQAAQWGLPKFREKFPIGRIPVPDIDGDTIQESVVIAEFPEDPSRTLAAREHTARERAHPHACPDSRHLAKGAIPSRLRSRRHVCASSILPGSAWHDLMEAYQAVWRMLVSDTQLSVGIPAS